MSSLLLPSSMREHHGSESTTFPVKGVRMATVERDAGFCSGGDDEEAEDELHSPTDVSEDSVEVKVVPISLRNNKNKRKCAEPRRVPCEAGPYKKRRAHLEEAEAASPFRPWSQQPFNDRVPALHQQEEPLSLVLKSAHRTLPSDEHIAIRRPLSSDEHRAQPRTLPSDDALAQRRTLPSDEVLAQRTTFPSDQALTQRRPLPSDEHVIQRRPLPSDEHCAQSRTLPSDDNLAQPRTKFSVESLLGPGGSASGSRAPEVDSRPGPSSSASTSSEGKKISTSSPGGQQRNYKNMTRERRIEANARERTRVHTISAAFDTLRRAIPAYSHNQKLSKLSVLRIACSYILTLSRVAGVDYSADQSEPSLAECVDLVSRTIQTEGKLRKKKDD